jgi:hypothetical protein
VLKISVIASKVISNNDRYRLIISEAGKTEIMYAFA